MPPSSPSAMPFVNHYRAPEPLEERLYHASTPLDEYDLNWVFGSVPRHLETRHGVRLVPLIPSIHAERLWKLLSRYPETYAYLPYGPFDSYAAFLTKLELGRRDCNTLSFAVYDLSLVLDHENEEDVEAEGGRGLDPRRLAGIVGVKESNFANRMSEIGNVHIAPPFQRTHVSTHSIALLLHWLLDPPTTTRSSTSPLGLRRVQWFANPLNVASVVAAQKLGFKLEAARIRWERTLPARRGKVALALPGFVNSDDERREREVERGGGRHSSLLSIDWERWETPGRGREFVDALVARKVPEPRNVRDVPGL